ncbi:MAG: hypothetical protein PHD02_04280 [Bacilli bacterium]|nr:hypothetical protein [Bacilli bacterium]
MYKLYNEKRCKTVIPGDDSRFFLQNFIFQKYFFKSKNKLSCLRELLAAKIADKLGLEHIEYKLACYNGIYGLLSKSFFKRGYDYLSLNDLVISYTDRRDDFDTNAIEIYFMTIQKQFYLIPNFQKYFEKFKNDFLNMILFDMIIGNWDRHLNNVIIEYNSKKFRMIPIFDNDHGFESFNKTDIHTLDSSFFENAEVLKMLIKAYPDLKERMASFLKIVDCECFSSILRALLKENITYFSKDDISGIFDSFVNGYVSIKDCIDSYECKRSK